MVSDLNLLRPGPDEYTELQEMYVGAVGNRDPLALLGDQARRLEAAFKGSGEEAGEFRYAPNKWSIKQVIGHIADTERIVSYRLLRISRGDVTPLPGFDEKSYAEAYPFDKRPLAELIDDFRIARANSLRVVDVVAAGAWTNLGTANGSVVSVRALLYILAGHVEHHLTLLRDRYGVHVPTI